MWSSTGISTSQCSLGGSQKADLDSAWGRVPACQWTQRDPSPGSIFSPCIGHLPKHPGPVVGPYGVTLC